MINANTILTRFFVSQYSHACACAISLDNLLLVFFLIIIFVLFSLYILFLILSANQKQSQS